MKTNQLLRPAFSSRRALLREADGAVQEYGRESKVTAPTHKANFIVVPLLAPSALCYLPTRQPKALYGQPYSDIVGKESPHTRRKAKERG